MAKQPKRSGEPWTPAEVKQLKQEARGNTPTRVKLHLGRTPGSVYQKASSEGVSLKPTNQRPNKGRGK